MNSNYSEEIKKMSNNTLTMSRSIMNDFQKEVAERVAAVPEDKHLCETAALFLRRPRIRFLTSFHGRADPSFNIPRIWWRCRNLLVNSKT